MFSIPEQLSTASKANIESHLTAYYNLRDKALEIFSKIAELNLAAAKSSLEETSAAAKQFLAAKDPQEFLSLGASYAQPVAEKAQAYVRHLTSIASEVQTEFTKVAEAQIAETSRKVLELVEELTKNAPAGSENAIALMKSAIGNASAGYEQFNKSAKQAAETIEANLNNAVAQFTQPVAKVARAKK